MSFRKAIPNLVSLLRAVLAPFITLFAIRQKWLLALGVFTVSIASDWLDGWLAEKLDAKSKLGRVYLESGCDLIMTVGALAGLLFTGVIPWWILWPFLAVAALIWPVVVFVPETRRIRRICNGVCPLYYLAVSFFLLVMYCVKALGLGLWILCLIAVAVSIGLTKRHRLMVWLHREK